MSWYISLTTEIVNESDHWPNENWKYITVHTKWINDVSSSACLQNVFELMCTLFAAAVYLNSSEHIATWMDLRKHLC